MAHDYDCDETARAASLWFQWSDRKGFGTWEKPGRSPNPKFSRREGDTVTLADRTGVFARYRIGDESRLRRIFTKV